MIPLCVLCASCAEFSYSNMCVHKALQKLKEHVDLEHQCGYITMLNSNNRHRRRPSDSTECRGNKSSHVHFFFYGCACEGAGWKACRVELAVVHLPAMAIIALMVQIG